MTLKGRPKTQRPRAERRLPPGPKPLWRVERCAICTGNLALVPGTEDAADEYVCIACGRSEADLQDQEAKDTLGWLEE